ncbi:MAG: VOC family protein [Acidimicrobiia bacterium]|nr:VOC family protein [Acidimicrobiia bacterium]
MSTEDDRFVPEINAITLVTSDMGASLAFYLAIGLELAYGGPTAAFTSLRIGRNYVNLTTERGRSNGLWGRVIFHVESPDELWRRLTDAGYEPSFEPRDAPWGERYFHILDPDGHELSFARRLDELGREFDDRRVD